MYDVCMYVLFISVYVFMCVSMDAWMDGLTNGWIDTNRQNGGRIILSQTHRRIKTDTQENKDRHTDG